MEQENQEIQENQDVRFSSLQWVVILLAILGFELVPDHTEVAGVVFLFAIGVAWLDRRL